MAENSLLRPMDEQAEFVMSFVDDSREHRDPFEHVWSEVERNFLVKSFADDYNTTKYPLGEPLVTGGAASPLSAGQAILQDPETHQSLMTIAAKLVLGTMAEPGFISANHVGGEDVFKSTVARKLIEHELTLEGHFWTFVEWIVCCGIYGTSVIEGHWDYQEGPRNFRSTQQTEFGEFSTTETLMVPIYDDMRFQGVNIRHFYPDPGHTMLSRMRGAAKSFRVGRRDALARAESGLYKEEATKRAIEGDGLDENFANDLSQGDDLWGTQAKKAHPSFKEVIGFEYFGEVPWEPEDGITHRVVTVLNGETVRNKPWPRRIPFFEMKITPRPGSFYGISPGEVMRYDQDFVNVLKMMMADAVVRDVHEQPIINRNAVADIDAFRRFKADHPLVVEGDPNSAVAWNKPRSDIGASGAFYSMTKGHMREGGGALGAIQGLGLGSKRYSATEAAQTFDQAMDRPELWGQIVEREFYPPVGKYTLGMCQEMLEDGEDVQRRVGETEMPVQLGDILADFDVKFIGSRQQGSKAERLQAYREIFAASSNPMVAPLIPWIPYLRKYFEDTGAPEVSQMVGNPELIQMYLMLQQLTSPQSAGNGNGEMSSAQPNGMLPAQGFGNAQP